jgi:hypothetical protein
MFISCLTTHRFVSATSGSAAAARRLDDTSCGASVSSSGGCVARALPLRGGGRAIPAFVFCAALPCPREVVRGFARAAAVPLSLLRPLEVTPLAIVTKGLSWAWDFELCSQKTKGSDSRGRHQTARRCRSENHTSERDPQGKLSNFEMGTHRGPGWRTRTKLLLDGPRVGWCLLASFCYSAYAQYNGSS